MGKELPCLQLPQLTRPQLAVSHPAVPRQNPLYVAQGWPGSRPPTGLASLPGSLLCGDKKSPKCIGGEHGPGPRSAPGIVFSQLDRKELFNFIAALTEQQGLEGPHPCAERIYPLLREDGRASPTLPQVGSSSQPGLEARPQPLSRDVAAPGSGRTDGQTHKAPDCRVLPSTRGSEPCPSTRGRARGHFYTKINVWLRKAAPQRPQPRQQAAPGHAEERWLLIVSSPSAPAPAARTGNSCAPSSAPQRDAVAHEPLGQQMAANKQMLISKLIIKF